MQITLEAQEPNAIQSYSDSEVTINTVPYTTNLIVCKEGIVTDWAIESIKDLHSQALEHLITCFAIRPKIILIGHQALGSFPPEATRVFLANQGIGLECMSLGSACRTYNVLLSEFREVRLGLIFRREA